MSKYYLLIHEFIALFTLLLHIKWILTYYSETSLVNVTMGLIIHGLFYLMSYVMIKTNLTQSDKNKDDWYSMFHEE